MATDDDADDDDELHHDCYLSMKIFACGRRMYAAIMILNVIWACGRKVIIATTESTAYELKRNQPHAVRMLVL